MGFQLGPIHVRYYGIILMIGAVAGAWLARRVSGREKQDPDIVLDALIWVLIGGVVGARLWHIFTPPASMVALGYTTRYYLSNPIAALAVWRGGLGIPGAVLGGVAGLYLFTRWKKLSFGQWADIAAPALALGQAIGRWGNFVNQELYGAPTELPWAIFISPMNRISGFENYPYYHPLFLYESLWNLAVVFLLLWVGQWFGKRLVPGDVFLVYLIAYPFGRFWLEFLRLDSSNIGGFNVNQTLMFGVLILSAAALLWRHRGAIRRPRHEMAQKA